MDLANYIISKAKNTTKEFNDGNATLEYGKNNIDHRRIISYKKSKWFEKMLKV